MSRGSRAPSPPPRRPRQLDPPPGTGEQVLGTTRSLCPVCVKPLPARVVERHGRTYIHKRCPEHGAFEALHLWDDPELYRGMVHAFGGLSLTREEAGVDITSGCNLRCPCCFSHAGEQQAVEPNRDEILRKIRQLDPSCMVVLFGGEPTVRGDIVELVRAIRAEGYRVGMLTNGLRLQDERFTRRLVKAGMSKIQIQLDGLERASTLAVRGADVLERKLRAVENLRGTGVAVSLFAMLVPGLNEHEVGPLLRYAAQNADVVQALVLSSVCNEGRVLPQWGRLTNAEIIERLTRAAQITKQDFIQCTAFDVALSTAFRGTVFHRKSLSPCDAVCYLAADAHGQLLPLNRLLDLPRMTALLRRRGTVHSAGVLPLLLRLALASGLRPAAAQQLLRILVPNAARLFARQGLGLKLNLNLTGVFGLLVTSFHDRLNCDLEMIDNCTIHSDHGDRFISYCRKIILQGTTP